MKKKLLISIAAAVVVVVTVVCILLFRPNVETYRNIKIYKIEGTSEIIRDNESLEAYEQMSLKNNDEIVVSDESNLILLLDDFRMAGVRLPIRTSRYDIKIKSTSLYR
jgi:hypothetical protein